MKPRPGGSRQTRPGPRTGSPAVIPGLPAASRSRSAAWAFPAENRAPRLGDLGVLGGEPGLSRRYGRGMPAFSPSTVFRPPDLTKTLAPT